MSVTLQHFGGQIEDCPDDVAESLLRAGHVQIVGRRPESAMIVAPESAMLPPALPVVVARKKPKKGRKR